MITKHGPPSATHATTALEIRSLSKGESIYVPSNALHGAKALESGTLVDVFTPVREDLLGEGQPGGGTPER